MPAAAAAAVALLVALALGAAACASASAAAGSGAGGVMPGAPGPVPGWRLAKAAISDCSASAEADSAVATADELLEGLSFAAGNPFFLNVRATLESPVRLPLPTDQWVEKVEWTYDDAGRVKTAKLYKSSNDLSAVTLSYDGHGSVSKVVGAVTADRGDGAGATQRDFEASFVNEALGSGAYGANKATVVHDGTTANDTVLFTYDKDKNLVSVASSGAHPWNVAVEYVTAFKVPRLIRLSRDGEDGGVLLAPTYDGSQRLVALATGTWSGGETTLDGPVYEVQYAGGRVSRVRCYQDDQQVSYRDFAYDEAGNLTSIRAYRNGGVQLYHITFTWERA